MARTLRNGGCRTRIHRAAYGIVAAATLTAVLAGCSSDSDAPEAEESQSPAAAPTDGTGQSTPPADPVAEAVLDAYDGYWREFAAALTEQRIDEYAETFNERPDDVPLLPVSDYASLDALALVLDTAVRTDAAGNAFTGEPENHSPEVALSDQEGEARSAEVRSCFDAANWLEVDRETGDVVQQPGGQLGRYIVQAEARTMEDGRWRVTAVTRHTDQPC